MPYKLTVNIQDSNLVDRIKEYAKNRGVTVSFIIDNYFRNLLKTSDTEKNPTDSLPNELDELIGSLQVSDNFKSMSYKKLRDGMYEDRAEKY